MVHIFKEEMGCKIRMYILRVLGEQKGYHFYYKEIKKIIKSRDVFFLKRKKEHIEDQSNFKITERSIQ